MSKTKWGHDALAADLAEYLRETKGMLAWEDMQLGPAGSPRPDVFTMGKSYAKFRPMAYECKISVADFRSDVTAGKWQSYLNYACAVVFAAPAGLISKEDLPQGCGLIQRSEAGWRMAKGPTLQKLDNLPRDAWLKMMMDGLRRESERQRLESRHTFGADAALRKRFGDDVADLVRRAQWSRDALRNQIESEAEQRSGIQKRMRDYEAEQIKRIEYQVASLTQEQRQLAVELGLPADASISDMRRAVREACQRLSADGEVNRLRAFFERVTRAAELASAELPGPERTPLERWQ